MGLFDKYQLSNSTQIPQYVGSALPEYAKSVEMAQERYDMASQGALGINDTVTNSAYLPQDAGTWQKIKQNTDQDLDEWSNRGDYENLLGDVSRKARVVASRLMPIVESVKRREEYRKSLEDEKLGLTQQDKSTLLQMSDKAYKGVRYDESGKGFGQYAGRAADRAVDVNDTIRKALSIMSPNGEIRGSGGENGMWEWKTKNGWEAISKDDIRKALDYAYANDEDWKAHTRQQADLETFRRTANLDEDSALKSISAMPDGPLKASAMQAIEKGMSPRDVSERLVAQQVRAEQRANIYGYGEAKAYRKTENTSDQGYSSIYKMNYQADLNKEFEAMKRQWEKEDNENPISVQGPDSKLSDDEKNPDKVLEKNTEFNNQKATVETEIKQYENQLNSPGLSADKKVQLQSNLDNAKSRLNTIQAGLTRNEQILSTVRNRTAQAMGFSGGYDEMVGKEAERILPDVQKLYPNGLQTVSGKKLSANDIAQAIVEKRVYASHVAQTPGGGYGTMGVNATSSLTGVTIKGKDGTNVFVKLGANAEALNALAGDVVRKDNKRMDEFQKKFKSDYEKNVENFSIKSDIVGLSEKNQKRIEDVLMGAVGGVEFSEPGQFENIPEEDRPGRFKVVSIKPQGTGSGVTLQVRELDSDGKPTGKVYDAKVTNTSIADYVSNLWVNSGVKNAENLGRAMRYNSGARTVNAMAVGDKKVIGRTILDNGKESNLTLQPIRNPDNSVTYQLYDDNGTIHGTTTSSTEAGQWMDKFTGMDNPPQYANPKRRLKTTTKSTKVVSKTVTDVNN